MRFSLAFYRSAAVCSWISVASTLLLIFLPRLYAPAADFDARVARVADPAYVVRSWVYLLHPFVVLGAALGVSARLRRHAAGLASVGFLGFLLWAFTEAAQQALTLRAYDPWRRAYLVADEPARVALRAQMAGYDALWDAMFFLLLVGFLVGCAFYGAALSAGRGLTRTVGLFYLAAAGLTLVGLVSELGGPGLPAPLDFWLYPALQPLARALIGVWLWRHAEEDASDPLG